MLKSKIEFNNGRPKIPVNGKLHTPLAYTTYFEECGEYSDFIKSGYKVKALLGAPDAEYETDNLVFETAKYNTAVFELLRD